MMKLHSVLILMIYGIIRSSQVPMRAGRISDPGTHGSRADLGVGQILKHQNRADFGAGQVLEHRSRADFGAGNALKPGSCHCVANLGSFNSTTDVKQSACGSDVIKAHYMGACFQATGESEACSIDGMQHTFIQVVYDVDGQLGWIDSVHLQASGDEKCAGMGVACDAVEFVTREEWGARPPRTTTPIETPFSAVFVHHSAGEHCYTKDECVLQVQEIQDFHMDDRGYDDIGYNFLVGEDGRIYEGRGWHARGAHARDHNGWSHGVCIMGNFMEVSPDQAALEAVKAVMDCGVQELVQTPGHEVFGHRDGVCTACPGDLTYDIITTWPYYSNRTIPILC